MAGDIEIAVGCILVGVSLGSIAALAVWARRIIEVVAESDEQTARHIVKALNGEQ